MKEHKDIREDEIGSSAAIGPAPSKPPRRKCRLRSFDAVVGVCVLLLLFPTPQDSEPQSYFEEEDIPSVVVKSQQTDSLSDKSEDKGYIEILEETAQRRTDVRLRSPPRPYDARIGHARQGGFNHRVRRTGGRHQAGQ